MATMTTRPAVLHEPGRSTRACELTTTSRSRWRAWSAAASPPDWCRCGQVIFKLDETITRRDALEQVNEGYHDLLAGKNIRGVIIHES